MSGNPRSIAVIQFKQPTFNLSCSSSLAASPGKYWIDHLHGIAADKAYNLGAGINPTYVPVGGDWNGDGKTKIGLFRKGFFCILDTNGDGVFQQGIDQTFAFGGGAGDVPVVGDWNGNKTSKIGLFRQGFFWILDTNGNGSIDNVNNVGGDQAFAFGGLLGDVPMVGDWNGDGKSKVGCFGQDSSGFWTQTVTTFLTEQDQDRICLPLRRHFRR